MKEKLKRIRWSIALKAGYFFKNKHIIKQAIIFNLSNTNACTELIETGTFLGEMVSALRNHFKKIYSIELDLKLAKNAQTHFEGFKHIKILQGDSATVLQKLLTELKSTNPIFWLDGHYSGGITAKGKQTTPILDELRIIAEASNILSPIILIDDARLFDGTNGYPEMETIFIFKKDLFPNHTLAIKNDILILTPPIKA